MNEERSWSPLKLVKYCLLANALYNDQCEKVHHLAWKWCPKAFTLFKLWDYKIPQHSRSAVVLRILFAIISSKNSPMIKVAIKLQHTVTFSKKRKKKMQELFLNSMRVFCCWNLTIVDINFPLRQKWTLSVHRMFHSRMTTVTIQSKELECKNFTNFYAPFFNRCTGLIL